jgi:hypothetical protein
LIIDAPLYYLGATWAKHNCAITDVIARRRINFAQPEGTDEIAWLTEGGYNCLQDYALSRGGTDVIRAAIESGDPRPIEDALVKHHDGVIAEGGVLYLRVRKCDDESERHLQRAILVALGELVVYGLDAGVPDREETRLLTLKRQHPAFQQLSRRRKLPTNADSRYYAFLKTAQDGSERIIVVLNFQPTQESVEVDLSGVDARGLVEFETITRFTQAARLVVQLPPYGYRFFRVLGRENS